MKARFHGILSWFPTVAVSAGALFIFVSLMWPLIDGGSGDWTDEKAKAYQQAAKRYHNLSFEDLSVDQEREFRRVSERFEKLRAELEDARSQGEKRARWFKWVGIMLASAGALSYFAGREV